MASFLTEDHKVCQKLGGKEVKDSRWTMEESTIGWICWYGSWTLRQAGRWKTAASGFIKMINSSQDPVVGKDVISS
jgi:hypothetical protein